MHFEAQGYKFFEMKRAELLAEIQAERTKKLAEVEAEKVKKPKMGKKEREARLHRQVLSSLLLRRVRELERLWEAALTPTFRSR